MTNIKNKPEEADFLFYKYITDLNSSIKNLEVVSGCSNESVNKAENMSNNMEISYLCLEGDLNPIIDYKKLYNNFSEVLSKEYTEYLSILKDEKSAARDGGIVIPIDDIRNRIKIRQHFLSKYPDFIEKDNIKEDIENYYYFYEQGLDNTKITCEKSTMDSGFYDEVIKSYSKFLEEGDSQNSIHYNQIKNCYDKLNKG